MSKIAKFGREMLLKAETSIALQSSQILYTFVLRAEIVTTSGPKMVAISARNTKVYKICDMLYCPHFTTFRNQALQFYSL